MDPASAIGLAAALSELIGTALEIVNMANKIANAPKNRKSLTLEMVSLIAIMSNLKQRVDSARKETDPWFKAVSILDGDHGPLQQFKTALKYIAKKLEPQFGRDLRWAFSEHEIKDALMQIERIKTLITMALQDDTFTLAQATKNVINGVDSRTETIQKNVVDMGDGIQGISLGVMSLTKDASDQKRRDIATWLSPLNFLGRQDDIFRRRQAGTTKWLLESKEFQDWVLGKRTLLRCSGIPGGGKTTAASVVVEHLKSRPKLGKIAVTVIYCNYKEHGDQSVTNLISSLVKQLLQDDGPLPDELVSLYRRHSDRDTRPSLQEVSSIMHNLVKSYDKVFIVIDALDESPEDMGTRTNLATELLNFRSEKCNLMFTARNYAGLESLFPDGASIEIAATDEDVLSYVDARIAQSHRLAKHCRSHSDLQEDIRRTVVEKTHGMFLLARLHMDAMENKTTVKAVRTVLNGLPTSLNATYNDAMDRIANQNEEDRELAQRVLFWITFAKRPLRILELRHALAVEEGETDLDDENLADQDIVLSVCCGLIAVDPSTTDVRLVHYTLHTYLETVRDTRFPYAEVNITKTCLKYLTFDALGTAVCKTDQEIETRLYENPFLLYAAQYWGEHARGEVEKLLTDTILSFLHDEDRLTCCVQIMCVPEHRYSGYSQMFPRQFGILWVTASFGLVHISRIKLQSGGNVSAVDSLRGHSPLHRAALAGHLDVAKLLIDHGSSVDAQCARSGFTPLRVAAQEGHGKIVSLLIASGADVNIKANDGKQPLHGAASKGIVSAIESLLDRGADIEMRDTAMTTALHVAATNGHVAAVEFLLHRSAFIEAKDRGGRTAVHLAAVNGHPLTTLTLLRQGASPESRDRDHGTPLMDVAEAGQKATLLVLLEHGSDVNARDMRGMTALDFAVKSRRHETVSMLLRWGANANSRDQDGFTALHRASVIGDATAVTMLLKHGADVNKGDARGETPLQQAAWFGHTEVAYLLLRVGATVHDSTLDGQTALHLATSNGHSPVVAVLLGHGAHANTRNKKGETPQDLAQCNEHAGVVQLLSVVNPDSDSSPPSPGWVTLEKADSLDLERPVIRLPLSLQDPAKSVGTKPPPVKPDMKKNIEPGIQNAVHEATAKLSDPAIFKALDVSQEDTKVELWGALGFSLKAIVTVPGDGQEKKYFVKTRIDEVRDDLYYGEYLGLIDLHKACPSSVPYPVAHGNLSATVGCFLIMEYLEQDTSGKLISAMDTMSLAQKLAKLHSYPTPVPEGFDAPVFGFPAVTYCGPTPQANKFTTSWREFFVEDRMRMILNFCEAERGSDNELRYWIERTIDGPIAHLLADGHLGGQMGVKPAIVHGNLWYGNKMRGTIPGSLTSNEAEDILFDPSAAWCHSEFELGILCLFGGFSAGFFQEYHSLIPKTDPKHEYEDRVELYMLYHQLNHCALFGGEYRGESIVRMRRLCAKYPVMKGE
ncbi:hypothetical protein ACET3X_005616 [Alternaria dauci]|uniref:protein-ribulosamine 3-kinase n=1 Tax=Alternaria dauci TaxID=48095 RepID=A0ABR3UNI7_9PLEO